MAAYLPTEPSRVPPSPVPPASRSRARRIALSAAALLAIAAGGTVFAFAHGTAHGTGHSGNPGEAASLAAPRGATRASADATPAGQASRSSHSQATSAATPLPQTPASGVWIAQLASVPVSAGSGDLQQELTQARADVPGAQYLLSSDYASLNPGYWVVYHPGSFPDGTQAVEYCAAHGRTSKNQCVGRFLSNSPQDKRYICLPPGGDQETGCSRPT